MVGNKSDAPKDRKKKNINKEQNMKEKPFEVKNELPIS